MLDSLDDQTGPGRMMHNPDTTRTSRAPLRWLPVLLWMGVIFWLSSLSAPGVPSGWSIPGHFTLFAVLAALIYRALIPGVPPIRALAYAVLISSAYGITDEFHQSFVPNRMPDVVDWGFDTLGAFAGALLTARSMRAAARRTGASTR